MQITVPVETTTAVLIFEKQIFEAIGISREITWQDMKQSLNMKKND